MSISREKCLTPLSALLIALLILPSGCSTNRTFVLQGSKITLADSVSVAVDVARLYTSAGDSVAVRDCIMQGNSLQCIDQTSGKKKVKVHL